MISMSCASPFLNTKQIRQRAFTVIAHWPLRSPLSLFSPTLLSGLKSCRVLATFNADNKSNAPAKSKPRNWLGVSPSHTLRLAALRHDWIMAETYYGQRTVATAVSKTSRVLLKIKFEMPADEDRLKYEPGPNHCSRFT